MTSSLSAPAPAKINLHLDVGPRRADGFHEVVNVMQTLDLADELTVSLRPRDDRGAVTLNVRHEPPADARDDDVPTGDDNLVVRAARAVLDAARRDDVGVHVDLVKRIPAGGGLAGGSSDAATTLRLVDALLDHPLDETSRHAAAATLGSDVPFFLVGGTALCTGRGEVVEPIAQPAPFDVTLVIPPWRLPTRDVYASHSARPREGERPDIASWRRRFDGVGVDALEEAYRNDLERAAIRVRPDLAAILSDRRVHLSGSGSTLFTWAPDHTATTLRDVAGDRSVVRARSRNR